MAKGTIYIDTRQIDRLVVELKGFEEQVSLATISALKRTLDHVKTKTGQIISKEYSVKSSFVKEFFKGGPREAGKLTMNLLVVGRTLTMGRFPHSPTAPRKRKYKVKVAIKRGGRKTVSTDPSAFIAPTGAMSPDKIQSNVFVRLGKKRLPIRPLFTLSVPQMVTNEKVAAQIQEAANKKLAERLEHEIIYRMLNSFKTSR